MILASLWNSGRLVNYGLLLITSHKISSLSAGVLVSHARNWSITPLPPGSHFQYQHNHLGTYITERQPCVSRDCRARQSRSSVGVLGRSDVTGRRRAAGFPGFLRAAAAARMLNADAGTRSSSSGVAPHARGGPARGLSDHRVSTPRQASERWTPCPDAPLQTNGRRAALPEPAQCRL